MLMWVIIGLLEWAVGQWALRLFEAASWPASIGGLFNNLGLLTLAACAFWAVRITLNRTGEVPVSVRTPAD